ncbi:MAG: GNAT family protein, partial [Aureliella sp.]
WFYDEELTNAETFVVFYPRSKNSTLDLNLVHNRDIIPMNIESNHLGQPIGDVVAGWTQLSVPAREAMEGSYCRLEPLDVASHARSLFAANQLDEQGLNWTYLPYGPFDSFDGYRLWMESTCLGDDPLYFAIRNLSTDEVVGVASYLRIAPVSGSIEVGHLNFSPGLQKTPAATEAMFLMMERAFALGYRRYEWKCHSLNAPSRAAAQRLGLTFEGVFRQHSVVKGRNRDSAWYAAIDTEWPELRQAFATWLSPENFDNSGRQRVRLSELTAHVLKRIG